MCECSYESHLLKQSKSFSSPGSTNPLKKGGELPGVEMGREDSCCRQELCVRAGHAAGDTVASLISLSTPNYLCVHACACTLSFAFICGHCLLSMHLREQSYKLNSHYSLGAVLHNVKFINRVIRHLAV